MAEKKAAAAGRLAHHPDKLKNDLIARLNRIEGQVRGTKRLIEENAYCDEALNQIASIQAALSGAASLLLENHIRSCVSEQIRAGESAVIDELMKTIRRLAR